MLTCKVSEKLDRNAIKAIAVQNRFLVYPLVKNKFCIKCSL